MDTGSYSLVEKTITERVKVKEVKDILEQITEELFIVTQLINNFG